MKIQWFDEAGVLLSERALPSEHEKPLTAFLRELDIKLMREEAKTGNFPGPDVDEHPEGYDGPCYCRLCMSYTNS